MKEGKKKESVKTLIKLYDEAIEILNSQIKRDGASDKEIEFQSKYFKEIKQIFLKEIYSKKIRTINQMSDFIFQAQKQMFIVFNNLNSSKSKSN